MVLSYRNIETAAGSASRTTLRPPLIVRDRGRLARTCSPRPYGDYLKALSSRLLLAVADCPRRSHRAARHDGKLLVSYDVCVETISYNEPCVWARAELEMCEILA